MTHHERAQHSETAPTVVDLDAWDWKAELKRQERSMEWLARRTQRSVQTVYSYSQGRLTPRRVWLEMARSVLERGME
jgi:hypothetical protein